MRIIITRHGETKENKAGIIQGHLHGTLSDLGKEQARKLAERLKDEKIDLILSSDLNRARDTAEEVAKFHPEVPFELREELRERFLGNFQGGPHTEYWHVAKWNDELCEKENIELLDKIDERARLFVEELISQHRDKNVLLIAHKGINISLIKNILDRPYENIRKMGKLDNTSITIFELDEKGDTELKLFNCTKHLD